MTWFQTYVALVKGYVGACVLFTPKAFANGGYLFSPIALFLSGFFTTICALRLIKIGKHLNCFSYSEIVKKAFGQRGRRTLDFMIFMTQYAFTISSIAYQSKSLMGLIRHYYGLPELMDTIVKVENDELEIISGSYLDNIWTYGVFIITILTLLAWVRNIATFRFTFLFANILLVTSVIIVCCYSFYHMYN